jgi:hydroxymethylpyrimidine/phosphomethylpyrimidine kinase
VFRTQIAVNIGEEKTPEEKEKNHQKGQGCEISAVVDAYLTAKKKKNTDDFQFFSLNN